MLSTDSSLSTLKTHKWKESMGAHSQATNSSNLRGRRLKSQCTGNSHIWTDTWIATPVTLSWQKRAVERALMDSANNVCSCPEILAKVVEHLSKILHYNNYHDWLINKGSKSVQNGPLLHSETQNEIKKQFFYLCSLLFRSKWGLHKDLQVHTYTGLFQGCQHAQITLNAFQGQGLYWPKEGPCIPLAMPVRWM